MGSYNIAVLIYIHNLACSHGEVQGLIREPDWSQGTDSSQIGCGLGQSKGDGNSAGKKPSSHCVE